MLQYRILHRYNINIISRYSLRGYIDFIVVILTPTNTLVVATYAALQKNITEHRRFIYN